ncbi:MAG: 4-(cytidine 5'-diphospho)-2-C-methyl-D-erythritol kinase [Phycisphaerales bacterium JB043]
MSTLEREVPAKINLMLAVDKPRADGMHPIASWMCTIELCDHIEIEHRPDSLTSLYAIEWHEEAQKTSEIDWPIAGDLGVRAHRALEEEVGRELPLRMRVRKRIPVGAGLGGGSSDAAGVLVMMRELFELDVSDARLEEIGRSLGSDVPFFVRMLNENARAALVRGLGEDIEVTPDPVVEGSDELHVLLMVPGCECSTGEVYRAFDAMVGDDHTFRDVEVARASREGVVRPEELFNDLEAPACDIEGRLFSAKRHAVETLGGFVWVTGSGSALYSSHSHRVRALEASAVLADVKGIEIRIVV